MSFLWVLFSVGAAGCQTARNAMQRELTDRLGSAGAAHVRFLFGFPFALAILGVVMAWTGDALPHPGHNFWIWVFFGALTQILATAWMLQAMTERSFVVTVAYIKTEPVMVAVFGVLFLHEILTAQAALAVLIATAGIFLVSWRADMRQNLGPVARGLGSAAMFAFSSVAYRGAIVSLTGTDFVMAASFTLAIGLSAQALLLSLYLFFHRRAVLNAIFRLWRPSLFAGFMGAIASELWFLAFALTSAVNVRTLALLELLFAQGVSTFLFKQKTRKREAIGIVLIVLGLVGLAYGG